jgi:hypothetical protein
VEKAAIHDLGLGAGLPLKNPDFDLARFSHRFAIIDDGDLQSFRSPLIREVFIYILVTPFDTLISQFLDILELAEALKV